MTQSTRRAVLLGGAAAAGIAMLPGRALALTEQERLVEESRLTLLTLLNDTTFPALGTYIQNSRAVVIVPTLLKGGFILGGQGGDGVLVARAQDRSWGYPIFITMAAGSVGLQIGGQVSQVVLTIVSDRGLNAVRTSNFQLGAGAGASLVTVGAGVEARSGLDFDADMYSFSLSQGLFAGGTLEGSVILDRERWNAAYYGEGANSDGILAGFYANPHADPLRAALPR